MLHVKLLRSFFLFFILFLVVSSLLEIVLQLRVLLIQDLTVDIVYCKFTI